MFAALALFALSQSATITIAIPGANVSQAVRQIGEAGGLKLRTREPIANQLVLVDVHGADVEGLLAHVARAVHGEWIRDGDTRVLTRSAKLQSQMEASAREMEARQVDAHLKQTLKAQRPWTDERCRDLVTRVRQAQAEWQASCDPAAEETLAGLSQQLPFQSGLTQLLASIGGSRIAGLKPLERIVFSSRPNAMQRPLPSGCDAVLRDLSEAVARFNKEVVRQGGGVVGYGDPATSFYIRDRVVLSIQGDGLATLRIEGRRVASSWLTDEAALPQEVRYPETAIPLSPEAQWIADWWRSRSRSSSPPEPLEGIRRYLTSPADHPRVGTLVFECLNALAAHDGLPWVAWVPAVAQRRLEIELQARPTLRHTASALQSRGSELLREDGWLVVRPTQPTRIEWTERPLEPLQRFVEHVIEVGAERFLDRAELIARNGFGTPVDEVAMLDYPTMGVPLNALIPLVGSLTPSQQSAAASPSGIALAQLAPAQVALAERALYEQDAWPTPPYEVTDAFPAGIPRDTVFKMTVVARHVAQPWIDSAPNARAPLFDARQLAEQIGNRTQGKTRGAPWEMADRYRPGSQNVYHLALVFRSGETLDTEVAEAPILDKKPVPWEQFPEPFRSAVEQALKNRGG